MTWKRFMILIGLMDEDKPLPKLPKAEQAPFRPCMNKDKSVRYYREQSYRWIYHKEYDYKEDAYER